MRHTQLTVPFAASLVVLALAACSSPGADASAPASSGAAGSVPSSTAAADAPAPAPYQFPLTGLTGKDPGRSVAAVKIENSYEARPQVGIDRADIVFEEMVEGGITRFMAVFHSNFPDTVGPVRSVRPMDPGIAKSFGGTLIFSGGAPWVTDLVKKSGVPWASESNKAGWFRRDGGRRAPHNLMLRGAKVSSALSGGQGPAAPFTFGSPSAGTAASRARMVFSSVADITWTWDKASKTWKRAQNKKSFKAASGRQVAASNVVVLKVAIRNTGHKDAARNPVPETIVVGSGTGIALVAGTQIPITWSKESIDHPFVVTDTRTGSPITLTPGRTWVELLPNDAPLTVS